MDITQAIKIIKKAADLDIYQAAEAVRAVRVFEAIAAAVSEKKRSRTESVSAAAGDGGDAGDLSDAPARKKRTSKEDKRNTKFAKLWARLMLETSDAVIAAAAAEAIETYIEAPSGSLANRIRHTARMISSGAGYSGLAWARLAVQCQAFRAQCREERLTTSAMNSRWKALGTGLEYEYVVKMIPTGMLIRDYPRIRWFSAPTQLINQAKRIREMLRDNLSLRSLFQSDPIPVVVATALEPADVPKASSALVDGAEADDRDAEEQSVSASMQWQEDQMEIEDGEREDAEEADIEREFAVKP